MKNGWTGGQYSIVRAIFGAYLFIHFAAMIPRTPGPSVMALAVVAAIASVFLAIGLYDRIAAVLILSVLVFLFARNPVIADLWLPYAGGLLLAHAFVPAAPFGSWAARGRTDPRGGWTMPPTLLAAMWIAMSLGYAFSGWTKLASSPGTAGMAVAIMELLYAPLALFRRARPWIWLAMLALHFVLMVLTGVSELRVLLVIVHLFTFDPAWVPQRAVETTETLLYDGSCGLCHRSVRLILAEDRSGTAFRFEPLPEGDQTSVIVQTADGRTLIRSHAVIHILHRLGGYWRVIGVVFRVVPAVVRDAMYDGVARVRYRIFGRTKNACPIVPPDLRSRFT